MPHRLWLTLLLGLAACAGQRTQEQSTPLMSQRMAQRLTKPDMSRRSIYDPGLQSSVTKNSGGAAKLSGTKFKSTQFSGAKAYTRTPAFATKPFAQGDTQDRAAKQVFADADRKPADADTIFETGESRFTSEMSRDGGMKFRDAGKTFEATANRAALKSQQKNDRPKFIELEEHSKKPAYTEDQVRNLLGRGN